MNDKKRKSEGWFSEEELLIIYAAGSIIFRRLANRAKRALTKLEGGKNHEQNERNECVYQRAARLCRDFD